jgi:hypothetical protein
MDQPYDRVSENNRRAAYSRLHVRRLDQPKYRGDIDDLAADSHRKRRRLRQSSIEPLRAKIGPHNPHDLPPDADRRADLRHLYERRLHVFRKGQNRDVSLRIRAFSEVPSRYLTQEHVRRRKEIDRDLIFFLESGNDVSRRRRRRSPPFASGAGDPRKVQPSFGRTSEFG